MNKLINCSFFLKKKIILSSSNESVDGKEEMSREISENEAVPLENAKDKSLLWDFANNSKNTSGHIFGDFGLQQSIQDNQKESAINYAWINSTAKDWKRHSNSLEHAFANTESNSSEQLATPTKHSALSDVLESIQNNAQKRQKLQSDMKETSNSKFDLASLKFANSDGTQDSYLQTHGNEFWPQIQPKMFASKVLSCESKGRIQVPHSPTTSVHSFQAFDPIRNVEQKRKFDEGVLFECIHQHRKSIENLFDVLEEKSRYRFVMNKSFEYLCVLNFAFSK